MLGFAPALRFLWSPVLYRLYKSPSDETINRDPACVYMHAERSLTYVKDPLGHVMSSFGYGNTKITQHALKVSVFIRFKLDTVGKKKKERNRDRERQSEEEKREKRKQERERER